MMYVEFFGITRQRVEAAVVEVAGGSLGEVLRTVRRRFPLLAELITADGHLHPSLAANVNGDVFVSDPTTPLRPDDHLLILSADAGG
jgi:molybdopterin converting factor small subunit